MNDLKQKVFALYWGQRILSDVNNSGINQLYPIEASNMYRIEESCLEVTPLHLITDEHAIEVDFPSASSLIRCLDSYGDEFNDIILKHSHIDFLRSNGYALPAFGHLVEELVTMGIFKLREGKLYDEIDHADQTYPPTLSHP